MELEIKIETKEVEINGESITVKSRISTREKETIIGICLKNASLGGTYNKLRYETTIYAMLVLYYSNIAEKIDNFKEESNADLTSLYDKFDSNGITDTIINEIESMNKGETILFLNYATEMYNEAKESADSVGYALSNLTTTFSTTIDNITTSLGEYINDPDFKEKLLEEATKALSNSSTKPIA
jgi:hypothetical protein